MIRKDKTGDYYFIDMNGIMHWGTLPELKLMKEYEDKQILEHNQT